jgi:hypothetical protein
MTQQKDTPDNEFFVDEVARSGPPSRTPAIVGFLIGGAVILALGFVGAAFDGSGDTDDVPALRVIGPAPGDTVENPVAIRFTTPADLRLERTGWGTGELHLHAMADHREIMPGPRDISVYDGVFSWQLPELRPGEHRVYLTWAGRNHMNLRGQTDTLVIHVRR